MAAKKAPARKSAEKEAPQRTPDTGKLPECFVIMPISDPEGYAKGHFRHVYDDIVAPACRKAKFEPVRGDDVNETNLIHLDILERLLESPMCVCDLSSRNPNVLFELGVRQAFDKPVALIREEGTKEIFDIAPLRYADYRKELVYHEVLKDQEIIANAIRDTFDKHKQGKGINSIVRLLSLERSARLVDPGDIDAESGFQRMVFAEIKQLRSDVRRVAGERQGFVPPPTDLDLIRDLETRTEIDELISALDKIAFKWKTAGVTTPDERAAFRRLSDEARKKAFFLGNDESTYEIKRSLNSLDDVWASIPSQVQSNKTPRPDSDS